MGDDLANKNSLPAPGVRLHRRPCAGLSERDGSVSFARVRQREGEFARRMERGNMWMRKALSRSPPGAKMVLTLHDDIDGRRLTSKMWSISAAPIPGCTQAFAPEGKPPLHGGTALNRRNQRLPRATQLDPRKQVRVQARLKRVASPEGEIFGGDLRNSLSTGAVRRIRRAQSRRNSKKRARGTVGRGP